jgi:hypothetical protein
MLPAMANTLVRRRSLAWWIAADRFTVVRLAIVPNPMATREVSPNAMMTSCGSTTQVSATTWAKIVSMPCPCAQAPEVTYIDPLDSIRTTALSKGPTPLPST